MIAEQRISIWYSAPSILALLAQFGALDRHDYGALRLVLFAGEVFAVKHLRTLTEQLPWPRYFNLYGPTETNVCTFYEVQLPVPPERTEPYPIGITCSHLRCRVVDVDGGDVAAGQEGELCIERRGRHAGLLGAARADREAFLHRRLATAGTARATRRRGPDGDYIYLGRRDRMVKRRGYRVELGEIEAGLYQPPGDQGGGGRRAARRRRRREDRRLPELPRRKRPSLIEMKRFCAENLPLYMMPDRFSWHEALPRTSTDKIGLPAAEGAGLRWTFRFSEEQKLLRDKIVRFARDVLNPGRRRARPQAGVLARSLAQVRRDRHPGPARARAVRRQRARSA